VSRVIFTSKNNDLAQ